MATTKAVVASCVVDVPATAVGAVGTPVNAGEARGANDVATKLVVAICVVFVPGVAVGAVGVPVNAGLTVSARAVPVPLVVYDVPHAEPVLYGIPTGGKVSTPVLEIVIDPAPSVMEMPVPSVRVASV